jgi:uncharacterized protein (TIGR02118 family)
MYPNGPKVVFDAHYYQTIHLPMVAKSLGSALKGMELDLALPVNSPLKAAPYSAITHLKFDDLASFQASFGPNAATFAADVKNYSTVQAQIQISNLIVF